jgi:hypothetical protein
MGARNQARKGLTYNAPPAYKGWRIRFLGIDFWAPLKFKIHALVLLMMKPQHLALSMVFSHTIKTGEQAASRKKPPTGFG